MSHNTMYERLVDSSDGEDIQGYVAYGLYKKAKREWIQDFEQRKGKAPSANDIAAYVASYTDQTIDAFETSAANALAEFSDIIVEEAKPEIIQAALKGTKVSSILLSIAANAIYTVILIVLALVLSKAGIDLLGIFQAVEGK